MANLITVGRLVWLFLVVVILYRAPVVLAGVSMLSLVAIFAGDGLDGWVARRRGSTSRFGAVFDIAGDRVVETVLWIVYADLGLIPIWVPLLVVTRGSVVDALRSLSYADGMTAFGERNMMRSSLTHWLTAGRFMRGFYGVAKAIAFVFLAGLVGFATGEAGGWVGALYGVEPLRWLGWFFVWASVVLTVVRGLPVLFDAFAYLDQGEAPTSAPPAGPGR